MTETPTRHFVISTEAKQSSKISLPHGTRTWRQAARHHRAIIKGLWEMISISHSPFCQSADILFQYLT